jgi:hypothetical protein
MWQVLRRRKMLKRFDGKNRREIPHENARKIRRIQLK